MIFIDINQASEMIAEILLAEKRDGIKHAYFTLDIMSNGPIIFDTTEMYHLNVADYKKLCIHHSKSIPASAKILKCMKVASAVIHVFRDKDPTAVLTNYINQRGEYQVDLLGVAFGYMPANCEFTVIEVTF